MKIAMLALTVIVLAVASLLFGSADVSLKVLVDLLCDKWHRLLTPFFLKGSSLSLLTDKQIGLFD